MNKPELTESLNLLKFSFESDINIEVKDLDNHGKGEIWVYLDKLLLDVSDLNLKAQRSRAEYCRFLTERTPTLKDIFDFDTAFSYIVPMALQAKRKGEPVIELGQPDKVIVKPAWDLYPLIVSGMPNIWFGDRGSTKSKLAIYAALLMTIHDLEVTPKLGLMPPNRDMKILKLDFEVTPDADEYEWHRIVRGLDMEGAVQLKYRAIRRPLADEIESVIDIVNKLAIDLVIIDSLGPAAGGDLNTTEPALRFNEAVRQLNKTTVILAHTAKNQLGKRTVFGSSFYENLARNVWEITKDESEDDGKSLVRIGLKQTKSPPFSSFHNPMAFEWDFEEETERTTIRKYSADKIDSLMASLSLASKILSFLASGKKSVRAICEETGEPSNTVRQNLWRLKKAKRIEKYGEDYGLLYSEE